MQVKKVQQSRNNHLVEWRKDREMGAGHEDDPPKDDNANRTNSNRTATHKNRAHDSDVGDTLLILAHKTVK